MELTKENIIFYAEMQDEIDEKVRAIAPLYPQFNRSCTINGWEIVGDSVNISIEEYCGRGGYDNYNMSIPTDYLTMSIEDVKIEIERVMVENAKAKEIARLEKEETARLLLIENEKKRQKNEYKKYLELKEKFDSSSKPRIVS